MVYTENIYELIRIFLSMRNTNNKISIVAGILILLFFGVSVSILSGVAQPPDKPGKPNNPGGQNNPNNQNNTNLSSFQNTQPIQNVSPSSLNGKIRVEKQYEKNTSVELVRNSSTNYTVDITITENATNVSFYLQRQAVASSQNISNITMYLDGNKNNYTINTNAGPGNSPWIGFQIPEFTTRTVTFTSSNTDLSVTDKYDMDENGQIDGQEVRQAIGCFLFGTHCIDSELTGDQIRQVISQFLF